MSLARRFVTMVGVGLLPAGLLAAGPGLAAAAVAAPGVGSSLSSSAAGTVAVPVVAPAEEAEGESSQEAQALAQAQATGEQVEVTQAATETETVMANPDGTLTLSVAASPVRVEQGGELVDVDTTLQSEAGQLSTAATTADVFLDGDGQVGAGESLAEVSDSDGDASVGMSFEGDLAAPEVEGSTATYAHDENTAVRIETRDAGFAAHVLLAEMPAGLATSGNSPDGAAAAGPVYRFSVATEGGSVALVDGRLSFVDDSGDVVSTSAPLQMWDAQLDEFGDPFNTVPVNAELSGPAGTQVLELRPDPAFLSAADTVYPVTIDPDVTLTARTAEEITDDNVFGGYTDTVRVGSDDGNRRFSTFVNFPTGSLAGQTVTDAKLRMYQYGAGTCDPRRIEARAALTRWNGTWAGIDAAGVDTRFATSASFNSSGPGGGLQCNGARYQRIDVTGQVSSWAGNVTAQNGLFLTTPVDRQLNTTFAKRFCSDDLPTTGGRCAENAMKPTLEVTYTPYIGDQGWYSTTERKLDERSTLKVNHQSGNTYVEAQDVQVSSVGMDALIGRRYNSRAETVGQFGPKWTMSGGPDVWLEKIDQWRYVYHAPDGAELGPFVREANAAGATDYRKFKTPLGGLGADLKDNNDNTFTLTFRKSQDKYTFAQMGTSGHLFQTRQQDRSGNTMTYDYSTPTTSEDPRLATVTDTAGRTYQLTYGTTGAADGFITQIRDANGPSTRTWTYDYADQGGARLSAYTDPEGDTTDYTWAAAPDEGAAQGQFLQEIADPANDSGQEPTTTLVTDSGETVRITYAGATAAESSGYAFTYQDYALPRCATGTDRSGTVNSDEATMGETTYCFSDRNNGDLNVEANNMTTTAIDAQGDTRSQSYSPDNQASTYSDSSGSTVNDYGDAGSGLEDRLDKSTQATDSGSEPASTIYKYNDNASYPGAKYLPVSMVDGDRNCTAYGYDAQGRNNSTWIGRDPNSNDRCDGATGGLQYQASYNADGTTATLTNPGATASTVFNYWQPGQSGFVAGTKGKLKSMQRPGGNCATGATRSLCTEFTYDGLSRTLSETDGNGEVTRSTYDVMDRTTQSLSNGATSCDTSSGECITYDYDAAGNLIERQDQGGTTQFTFDQQNRQTTQATPDGVEVSYTYNRDSRMIGLTQELPDQAADTVSYVWDNTGQVNSVTDSAGTINVVYDSNNRLSSTQFPTAPQATRTDRTYTNAGMPRTVNTRSGTSTNDQLTDYAYSWTKNGKSTNQLQSVTETNSPVSGGRESHFQYNNRGQLTAEKDGPGDNAATRYSYTYDDAGNMATAGGNQVNIGTRHFGYDRANQLCWTGPTDGPSPVATCPTTAPGTSKTVARDNAGNSEGAPDAPITYNPREQAVDIDGSEQGYYDQGNDLHTTTGTTHLVSTNPGITARTTNTDGSGAPTGGDSETTYYTRMPDGRLLSSRGPDGTFYYVTDNNNTVLNLIDAAGQRAGTYQYSPYGQATLVENTPAEAANPFRWISGYQDNTDIPGGYIKLGARFHNPTTGAFTQQDPEMGNMQEPLRLNAYAYGGGDPINNTDPSGRYYGDYEPEPYCSSSLACVDGETYDGPVAPSEPLSGCTYGLFTALLAPVFAPAGISTIVYGLATAGPGCFIG